MSQSKRSGQSRKSGRRESGQGVSWNFGVWTVAIAAVLVAVVSTVPGSLALWNDADAVDAGTVTSGLLDAAIAPGTATPTTETTAALDALTDLVPGESRGATFTVRNTGNVPTALSAARTAATNQYLVLDLSPGACQADQPAGVPLSSTPVAVGTAIQPATNAAFCLRITLDANAPAAVQGAPVGPYGINLTAGVYR